MLSPLPLNEEATTEVNKLFYTFLWNGKGDKIKRNIMIGDYNKGGLKVTAETHKGCNASSQLPNIQCELIG